MKPAWEPSESSRGQLLNAGANSLAAEANCAKRIGTAPQAGFIALLRSDGGRQDKSDYISGPDWRQRQSKSGNAWAAQAFDDSAWPSAVVVAEVWPGGHLVLPGQRSR